MKTFFARAALGLALLGGVASAQPSAVSAQGGGGELARMCQDPGFREIVAMEFNEDFDPPAPITVNTTGECVSLVQTFLSSQSSRVINLLCQNPDFLGYFGGNQGRCIAALNAEFKR
jgi:hypothetical protein